MTEKGESMTASGEMSMQPQPTGGTFTLTQMHGVSDPVPFDAPAAEVGKAADQAFQRNVEIVRQHRNDPELFAACPICTPRYVSPVVRTPAMRQFLEWRGRAQRLGFVLRETPAQVVRCLRWIATSEE